MPVKYKIWICFFWVLLISSPEVQGSIPRDHEMQRFSINHGLSQSWVRCLYQDSKGLIWIGTQDGLNRYDGYTFRIFRHELYDSTSIIGNTINSIIEDDEGNLWIGTESGLSKFNRGKAIFENFFRDSTDLYSVITIPVYQVIVESGGKIVLQTLNGLLWIDPGTGISGTYQIYNDQPFSPPIEYIFPLIEDNKGRIWTGTHEGLYFLNETREKCHRFRYDESSDVCLSSNHVLTIHQDHKGQIWIGTDNGLNKFNPSDSTFTRYYIRSESSNGIPIYGLFYDPTGTFWIGTGSGIYHFDEQTGDFRFFEELISGPGTAPGTNNSCFTFIKDRSEIIWAGGSQGLLKYDRKKKNFKLYQNLTDGDPDFSSNEISAIFEDAEKILWIGTWGGGLNLYTRQTGEVIHYYKENPDLKYRISNDVISCICQDSQGVVWVGTERGLNVFDKETERFLPFCYYINIEGCREFDRMYINHIMEDHLGNIWISTSGGLAQYQRTKREIKKFNHFPDDSLSISSDFVYFTMESSDNLLWIGTRKGLNRYDPAKGEFISFQAENKYFPSGLSDNNVYHIHEDGDGILWIGTGSGLNRFSRITGEFTIFTERSGLPNNLIYAILEDENRNIWMSTNRGIAKFNTRTGEIYTFDTSDDLQSSEFNIGAYFKSGSGEFFFGGVQGFNSFYPDSIQLNPYPPGIVITSFQYLSVEGWEEAPVAESRVTIKTRETNMFAIEFAALEFTQPQKNQYEFYLDGLEETWHPKTTERRAVYSNLDPGEYLFRVRGSNNDLVWNRDGTILEISIISPVWRTRYAYGFYLAIIILLILLFIRYRTKNLKKANRILQEKQRASLEVEKQKEELSVKNKNITDSINYAKKIQEAMLPSNSFFKRLFPQSFIFYRPKDIVSGDFYWVNGKKDKVFVTAVDCTGHGVPGAFMSMIGFEILAKIINDQGIEQPAEILNILSDAIEETFSKGEDDITLKDGMDIAFCVIDRKEKILQFAGAFNPLYLLRDNTLTEIKGDRMSVGITEGPEKLKFTNHIIPLEENDVFYIFSDGYADQFGGPNGKKFMYRRFRHLLLTIHRLEMKDQLTFLEDSFDSWVGNLDQIDDVLIIGVKPGS
ncbi:MAG: SpoIIE family protein phosphatase [Bacteroidales bacterium]|nr:MAG: SpoIIE family protein phosphatase [Bacteroidales bacterium]